MRTLQFKLLVSHMLPVLLSIPLVGLALMYLLETQVLLPSLADDLVNQGLLVAQIARTQPGVWDQSTQAQALIDQLSPRYHPKISLLKANSILLASNRTEDLKQVGMMLPGLPDPSISAQDVRVQIISNFFTNQPIIDVVVPVVDPDGNVLGLVRIFHGLNEISQPLSQARIFILGTLILCLALSMVVGSILAETMSRPLRQITRAIAETPVIGNFLPIPESEIPEIKLLIQSFNRLQERRFQLEVSRQQMLANLVHELGRPIGSIQAGLHALLNGADKNEQMRSEFLQGISDRVEHMALLVEDLAASYQQAVGPLELKRSIINIREWLKPKSALWKEFARQKGLQWYQDLPENLPILKADPDRLGQALGNLVDNALKFTPPGGSISIQAGIDGRYLRLRVIDSGVGIPLEDQQHVFDAFYRSIQPAWKVPGLGLGLAITRSIIEAHGGFITLQSQVAQGSTFTIYLPLEAENLPPVE
jgi:two-component system, OmpR family, sensor histidine kinase BaeS